MNILEIKIMSGRTIVIPIIFWVCFICTFAQENVIRFHRADRQTIVRTHNDLRRSIYNAANMRELVSRFIVMEHARENCFSVFNQFKIFFIIFLHLRAIKLFPCFQFNMHILKEITSQTD